MAKTIKEIKCPSCGSAKVKELRADYYQCESCGTEFFLDNDDININVNYNHTPNSIFTPRLQKAKWGLIVVVALFVLIPMLTRFLFPSHSNYSNSNNSNNGIDTQISTEEKKYSWGEAGSCIFTDAQGNLYYVIVGKINSNDNSSSNNSNDVYLALYNAKDSKLKWIKKLFSTTDVISSETTFNVFDDNNLYIDFAGDELYRIDATTLAMENMKEAYEKNIADFGVGIAKINYQDDGYSSSTFEILNNENKYFWYMPLINKICHSKDELNTAAYATPPNNTITKTAYIFSRVTDDYPNENPVLVKYHYKYAYGYAHEYPDFGWSKDYLGSGIIVDDETPYKKVFIDDWSEQESHMVDYTIMIPDRTFISPQVLDFDATQILIAYKPTPADGETYTVQLLNAQNGNIIKTIVTSMNNISVGKLTKDGSILLYGYDDFTYYDNTGKIINTIKSTDDLNIDKLN